MIFVWDYDKKNKKNYDDKYKINKILKNEIRKKTN
jgi:hypothetical protein